MQRCPEPGCGHLNRPSARFCKKCGRTLRERGRSVLERGHLLRGGTYRILEPLGQGGMGALYLAADTGAFERRCVVKELLDYYDPSDPVEAQEAQMRFETEARLLAELSHPGIPRIYSYFSEAGRHYIIMEYIEGEPLELAVTHVDPSGRTVAARPLANEETVRHAVRICRILEYLANRPTPVIHHDIKPANLIVDRTTSEIRLVDFGTAQTRTRWATRHEQQTSALFGTRGYAAPEQFQGCSEPRSDVYALAATVYHILTDDDPGDHAFHFPQLERLPASLADALSRALRPEFQRRSTALELRQALEAWLIPERASQPFVFRSGAVAHTTEELVALCDRHWPEARQHLANGDMDQWFRAHNRHDLVAKAKSARLVRNGDAALEAFLHRLNPRLPPPTLSLKPSQLDFGRVSRGRPAIQRLTLGNRGRGYAQATFSPSVPWLRCEPAEVGCLAGTETTVKVWLDAEGLPLGRNHDAILTCTPAHGARLGIPVTAQLSPIHEATKRAIAALWQSGQQAAHGASQGLRLWSRVFRSLIRSRYGPWILLAETLCLAVVIVVFWLNWSGMSPYVDDLARVFLLALPLALLAIWLLPALAFIAGTAVWVWLEELISKLRAP